MASVFSWRSFAFRVALVAGADLALTVAGPLSSPENEK
jgi:hypothetical protein